MDQFSAIRCWGSRGPSSTPREVRSSPLLRAGSVCTSAMAEKEEDEEASVFYASFSFFSKSHAVFVGQSGIFQFFFFFSLLAPEPGTSAAPQIQVLNHEP
jgi:hypothetical protein